MESRHLLLCFLAYGTLLQATNAQDCEFSNRVFKIKRMKTNATTAEGCESRCVQQQNCIVWQLLELGKRCFLQVAVDRPNEKSEFGINNCKNGKPSENAPQCLVNKGYAKIIRKIKKGASAKDCRSSCSENSRCLIWQYNRRCEQYYLKVITFLPFKKIALHGIGYCNDKTSQTNSNPPSQTNLPGCRCGIKNSKLTDSKIVGGSKTYPHEYPWMVFVKSRINKTHYEQCGGTIISDQMILTAAHCVYGFDDSDISIAVGNGDISKPTFLSVKKITNPLYKPSNINTEDTALLLLKSKMVFDQKTKAPICLPPNGSGVVFEYSLALGWGLTSTYGQTSKILKEVNLVPLSNKYCESTYGAKFPDLKSLTDDQICAIGQPGNGVCEGDSGGPLMQLAKDNYVQTGVLSYGYKQICADKVHLPDVWIRTDKTMKFIMKHWVGQTCGRSG